MKENKIKNQKGIMGIAEKLKRKGKKLVAYSGSFDVLHLGHIKSLKEAKKQGDVLIILLNSDKSARTYKGLNRPIVPERERAETLSALECVDFIVIFDELTPKNILAKIKPDIYCSGSNWGKNCVERKIVEEYGGKIHLLRRFEDLSTSKLIERVMDVYSKPDIKAVFLDRDGTINMKRESYLFKIEDFKFTPQAVAALKKLSKLDYKIIIITNQSGIGRGYFKEKDLRKLHQWLKNYLRKKGARIDKIYYCPHQSETHCSCRKPKTGMLLKAVKDLGISLSKSWMVGDDERDVIMAKEANLRAIKLGERMSKDLKLQPDFYVKNLLEATQIILKTNKN